MSSTADYTDRKLHENSRAPEYGTANRAPEYDSTPRVTESAVEARQGVIEHKVSTVLIVSTVAVIVAFAALYAFFFA